MKINIRSEKSKIVRSLGLCCFVFHYNAMIDPSFKLKRIFLISLFITILGTVTGQGLPASDPPPPPSRGGTLNQNGAGSENGAPIGDGTYYLIGFALAYFGAKIIQSNKNELFKNPEENIKN